MMKKRILAMLLAVITVLSLLSTTAFAASYASISNGTYKITTALKSNMVLDVSGNNNANGTNIQIYEQNGSTAQQFTVTHVSNGWYKIIKVGTNKAVDVAGGVKKSGVNVQLYDWNGSNAQLWMFYSAGNGYYYIKNKLGYYLDVSNGSSANSTNVQVWDGNGTNAQKWNLTNLVSAASSVSVSTGTYKIITALKSNMVLDVSGNNNANGTNIQIYEQNGTTAQQFTITHVSNGWYKIIKFGTNKAIDVAGGVKKSGVNVQLYDWNGSNAQLWMFYSAGNGYYYIKNKLGYYLDVSNGSSANSTNVQVWEGNGTNAQKWNLTNSITTKSDWNISVSNKAKENKPHYVNPYLIRNKDAYNTIINQFNVATNSRYTKANGNTYCNIFAWDVMCAMSEGISYQILPHWVTNNNAPATSTTKGAWEMNANATYNWLRDYGSKSYGWRQVSAQEAQDRANNGFPTVAVWKNTSGGAGHVMVVRPEGNGYYYSSYNGPVIAQAGATNVNYWNVRNAMGSKISSTVYYTHD